MFFFLRHYTTFCLVSCMSLSVFGHIPLDIPNYPSAPVVKALFRASARRGVIVNGSAGHGVKKE